MYSKRAWADAEGLRHELVHSHDLIATSEEAVDPHAGRMWNAQINQFVHRFVRKNVVKYRDIVQKEQ